MRHPAESRNAYTESIFVIPQWAATPAVGVKVFLHHPTTIDFGVHIRFDTAGVECRFPPGAHTFRF